MAISVKTLAFVLLAVQLLTLLVAGLSCGLAQFDVQKGVVDYYNETPAAERMNADSCFTFWGFKADCAKVKHTYTGIQAYGCPQRKNMMMVAGVFAVLGAVLTLFTVVCVVLMIRHIRCLAIVPLSFTSFSALLFLIALIYVAEVSNNSSQKYCNTGYYAKEFGDDLALRPQRLTVAFKSFTTYGAGFGLLVFSFVLQAGSTALLTVMILFQ